MDAEFSVWVGVDCGSESHQVCAVDSKLRALLEVAVEHTSEALTALGDRLLELVDGNAAQLGVAIESPRGPVVEMLIERGIAVFSLNPKQLDRFRDRHTVAGAKDDRLDAFVLADSLRTDQPKFRRVRLGSAELVELRELGRARDELMAERLALGSRLRELLHRYFPQVLELGSVYESRWIWTLLERAATPEAAQRLSVGQLRTLLRNHRIRSVSPERVHEVLQRKPLHVAPGVVKAFSRRVLLELPRIQLVSDQLKQLDKDLEVLLEQMSEPAGKVEHRDVALALSLPGIGPVVCAAVFGEAWQPLVERDYTSLRAISGAAPVTRRSGKMCLVSMRYACNGRLREAVRHWALNASLVDPHTRAHYAALRAKGHDHSRACRGVADRLLSVLIGVLKSGRPYEASLRRRARAGAATQSTASTSAA